MLYSLSEDDQRILKALIAEWQSERAQQGSRVNRLTNSMVGVDTYLAQVPASQTLPALSVGVPGSLLCDIYRPDGTSAPVDMGFQAFVLNYTDGLLSDGQFVPVAREKYGSYIVCGGGGANASVNICDEMQLLIDDDEELPLASKVVGVDGSTCKLYTIPKNPCVCDLILVLEEALDLTADFDGSQTIGERLDVIESGCGC